MILTKMCFESSKGKVCIEICNVLELLQSCTKQLFSSAQDDKMTWCETEVGRNPDSKVHGANMGPAGPRWAQCCPHEPCYQGNPMAGLDLILCQISCLLDSLQLSLMMLWFALVLGLDIEGQGTGSLRNFRTKSMLVNKDFLTLFLIGWQLCCQPIKCKVWNFWFKNMEFNMEISK